MNKSILSIAAAAIVASASFSAHSATANATFAFGGLDAMSYTGGNLNSATSIDFNGSLNTADPADWFVTIVPPMAFGMPNDFAPVMNSFDFGEIQTPLTINAGFGLQDITDIIGFMSWNGGDFTFDLDTVTRNATAPGALDWYGVGTFNDATGGFDSSPASVRFTAQEIAGSTSWSASWATPPTGNSTVAEPETVALLAAGLFGAGISRRKKQK
ncbi:MAG: PEP-CTERM sorting domain-containing protein [Methyloprofundus sp.]|nr:PEP-CTERM sorting domain-containing protein [Methyloprofundus sp.]